MVLCCKTTVGSHVGHLTHKVDGMAFAFDNIQQRFTIGQRYQYEFSGSHHGLHYLTLRLQRRCSRQNLLAKVPFQTHLELKYTHTHTHTNPPFLENTEEGHDNLKHTFPIPNEMNIKQVHAYWQYHCTPEFTFYRVSRICLNPHLKLKTCTFGMFANQLLTDLLSIRRDRQRTHKAMVPSFFTHVQISLWSTWNPTRGKLFLTLHEGWHCILILQRMAQL